VLLGVGDVETVDDRDTDDVGDTVSVPDVRGEAEGLDAVDAVTPLLSDAAALGVVEADADQ